MSNVIKFERPPEPKEPKEKPSRTQMAPAAKRLVTWAGLVASFALAWIYFTITGS